LTKLTGGNKLLLNPFYELIIALDLKFQSSLKKNQMLKLLFFLSILLSSCKIVIQKPINEQLAKNNKDYKIQYLFAHDGCKLYKFSDGSNWIYFSNCNGDTTYIEGDTITLEV
jgi:hypothetical protein